MKRFFNRSAIFIAPIFILQILELFVLPIDAFTFRSWEALKVKSLIGNLPGPFYPNQHLQTVEEGDIGHSTPYAIKKNVDWFTDRYGYRKRDDDRYNDVVIVGDSLTAGSSLTQSETLAEVLAAKSGLNIYPLAPADMITFQREARFEHQPPKIVIVEFVERVVLYLPEVGMCQEAPPGGIRDLRYPYPLVVLADRFQKGNMLEFMRARLRDLFRPAFHGHPATDQSMLFLEGEGANVPTSPDRLDAIADSVEVCRDILEKRGIKMIFMPVPNKESIHYDRLPNKTPPQFLNALIPELRRRGIDVVDLQQLYTQVYHTTNEILYTPDDSHWNALGVSVAAEALAEEIQLMSAR